MYNTPFYFNKIKEKLTEKQADLIINYIKENASEESYRKYVEECRGDLTEEEYIKKEIEEQLKYFEDIVWDRGIYGLHEEIVKSKIREGNSLYNMIKILKKEYNKINYHSINILKENDKRYILKGKPWDDLFLIRTDNGGQPFRIDDKNYHYVNYLTYKRRGFLLQRQNLLFENLKQRFLSP